MNSILSTEVSTKTPEQKIREWAAQFGPIIQYLPFHYTLVYGCNPFTPNMLKFLLEGNDPKNPLYTISPKPIGFVIFPNKKKNYNALAIKYEWSVGKDVNTKLTSDPTVFPGDPTLGYNGEKYEAHITIGYIDGNVQLDEALIASKIEEVGLSFFDVTIEKITLEISVKPERK